MSGPISWRVVIVVTMLLTAVLACSLDTDAGSSLPPSVDDPLVELLVPVNGSIYAEGADVHFQAVAQDPGAGVSRIEFRLDDVPIGEVVADDTTGQASLEARITWRASGLSRHLVTVEAFRADGSSLGFSDVAVQVLAPPNAQLPGVGQPVDGTGADPAGVPGSTAVPSPTSPVADVSTLDGVPASVNPAQLNVRQGPGTNYSIVGVLQQGDEVRIIGRNEDSTWWAVAFNGGTAWVFADLITPADDTSQIPLVAAP